MKLENIQTPHPLKLTPDTMQQPLITAVDPEAMSDVLAIARDMDPEMCADAIADCTDQITQATRKALWCPQEVPVVINGKRIISTPYPNLENLENEQAAGCYGFTLIASKLMDRIQLRHWVTYVNGHAALLVPLRDGRVRYADPLLPDLNFDVTPSMDTALLVEAMDSGEVSKYALHFNTVPLAKARGIQWSELTHKLPWMATRKGMPGRELSDERDAKPIATVFPSGVGQYVLENHAAFLRAVHYGDSLAASESLTRLGDQYPEMDLRRKHTEIRQIARDLAAGGHVDLALASITTYVNSIRSVTDDPRLDVLHGDCLRAVAATSGNGDVAVAAIGAYEKARDAASHDIGLITMKLTKAQRVAAACLDAALMESPRE